MASSVRRPATALFSFALYSTKGSKRRSALPSWLPRPPIPCAPPATSSWMYWRVSASRLARNWSSWTFGSVWSRPNWWPSSTCFVPAPRFDLDHHVVQPGFRPQQELRVGMDQLHVLRLDLHPDHRVAVFEVDRADLADLDPGDVDRLALTGGDRLRGRELGRDVFEFFADQGQPRRQRGFLLGEDPEHHHDADEGQDDDRDRVGAVPAHLPAEPGAEVAEPFAALRGGSRRLGAQWTTPEVEGEAGPTLLSGPLTSGTGLVSQRTSGFSSGCAAELRLRPERVFGDVRVVDLVAEQVALRVRFADQHRAAAGLGAQVGAVAVEVLRRPGEVDQVVEEFAVVRAAGAELVVDRLVAGRHQHLRGALAELVELRQRHFLARLRGARQARRRFGEQLRDAAALLAGEQRADLGQPRFRGADQARQLGDRRGQLDRVGAQRRQRLVEADQRAVRGLQGRRQFVDRGREVFRLVGERPGEDVEVVDQPLQRGLVGGEGGRGAAGAGDQLGEVALLGAEQRVGHLRAVFARFGAEFEGLVQRLRRRRGPCTCGSWVRSSAAVGSWVSAWP